MGDIAGLSCPKISKCTLLLVSFDRSATIAALITHNVSSPVKNLSLATACAFLVATGPVLADPALMLGGTFTFGAMQDPNFGITARLLENDRANESTLGAGVTYYLFTGDIGVDVFAGYLFESGVFGFGYDLVQAAPIVSLGLVNTE